MTIELHLLDDWDVSPIDNELVEKWVTASLRIVGEQRNSLTVKLVNLEEIQHLNLTFRGRDKPTNVLSFSFEAPPECEIVYLGDIAISPEIVKNESNQQDISFRSHFAHMVIHGTLHLCGYDHENDQDAEEMEALEQRILQECGLR